MQKLVSEYSKSLLLQQIYFCQQSSIHPSSNAVYTPYDCTERTYPTSIMSHALKLRYYKKNVGQVGGQNVMMIPGSRILLA